MRLESWGLCLKKWYGHSLFRSISVFIHPSCIFYLVSLLFPFFFGGGGGKQIRVTSAAASYSSANTTATEREYLRFKATLVWTDPPASVNAKATLINNLDLQVVVNASSQGQVVHYGNGYPDNINNVEQVSRVGIRKSC